MFKIHNDRESFFQWDINQKLVIESNTSCEVHFSNILSAEALVCISYELDGLTVVDVPNILLTEALDIKAYMVVDNGGSCETCHTKVFEVNKRSKPADYVYTETEIKTIETVTEDLKKYITEETEKATQKVSNKVDAIIVKATGEAIVVNDSAAVAPNIKLYGKSTQKQYEGYQLFDISSLTGFTVEGNTIIKSKNKTAYILPPEKALPNTQYYISFEYDVMYNDAPLKNFNILVTYTDGSTDDQYICWCAKGFATNKNKSVKSIKLRTMDHADEQRLSNLMISIGSTALPYEPYTNGEPVPNLNYQQEVTPIGEGGSIVEKLYGGNLLNESIATVDSSNTNYMIINMSMPNCDWFTISQGNIANIFLYQLDGNDTIIDKQEIYGKNVYSFTPVKNATKLRVRYDVKNIGTMMMNYGVTALPYVSYVEEHSLTLQTPNGLHGIGNVADVVDSGQGKRINVFSQKVFNGSESWLLGSGNGTHYRFYLSNAFDDIDTSGLGDDNTPNALCTAFRPVTPNDTYMGGVNTFSINARKMLYVCCSCATVEEFKQKLSEKPMTVYYQLAEPIETPLTEEEQAQYDALHMNYPNTTIVNDAGAYMEVEYVADTKNYIGNLEDKHNKDIAELKAAIIALGGSI